MVWIQEMDVDKRMELEETESNDVVNSFEKVKNKHERCSRCLELQDIIRKANEECARLELDIRNKNSLIESQEGKLGLLEQKNIKIEHEISVLKQRNEKLEKRIGNGEEEEDNRITQLMIENNVLECEKKNAETEVGDWKVKCRELEMNVIEFEKKFAGIVKNDPDWHQNNKDASADTIPVYTPPERLMGAGGYKEPRQFELKSRVRKFLDFADEGNSQKHLSPSTPGGRPPFGPIHISDSDRDDDLNDANMPLSESKRRRIRSRVAHIVTSESENDSDDNIPICRLSSKYMSGHRKSLNGSCSKDETSKKTGPRRRLVRVGTREDTCTQEIMNESTKEDEIEDGDSHSEGESLGGFIVNSSGASESASASNCNGMSENHETFSTDSSGDLEGSSESSMAYDEVMSSLRRDRKDKMKWDFEADMLADFGKYPELCMKAVCALYRQQTYEEKSSKTTIVTNGRGFNHVHAYSGSALAEFLSDGDRDGDVKKSVKELEGFDSKGVEKCRKLATHYSKQLFEIYKNEEDPLFHP